MFNRLLTLEISQEKITTFLIRYNWYCQLKKHVLAHSVFDFCKWLERHVTFPLFTPPSLPPSPLYLQAFVATGTNLSLQFFPANLLGDQRQVPTREYVDFERETGKVGQVQDTLTLTCVTLCPPRAVVCETSTYFNIRRHVAAVSHDFSWFDWHFSRGKNWHTSTSAGLLSVPLLVCDMKMTVQTSDS